MEAERWSRIQELFEAAADLAPGEQAALLDKTCADEPGLKAEVVALLAADTVDRVGGIVSGAAEAALEDDAADMSGTLVGPYRIEREIGRGGMGTVYLAHRADGQYEQQVAIKVVRERLARPDLVDRFRDERQILAHLEHPNIARLLDGGTTAEGSPYVIMEHVEGESLDRYCQARQLSVKERLNLFLGVCDAVCYAHRNLVVHRDLKPSNVLVTGDGTPKLLDFGVAKLLDPSGGFDTRATGTMARMLTPEYASPEQIRGEPVSTASDTYSLGVMLYELLTRRRPYRESATTPADLARAICEDEPERPSTAATREDGTARSVAVQGLHGDLDNIVLMALRKEPERRYASATELSDDIRRHLSGHPVHARPSTWSYRAGKFIRRHKLSVASAALAALLIVGAAVVSTVMFIRADRAQATAEEINRFLTDMLSSVDPAVAQGQDVTLLRRILDEAASRIETELAGQPEVAASLHGTIGSTYYSLGLYHQAEPHLREALSLEPTTVNRRKLSMNQRELSRLDEAEALARQALEESRARFGSDSLDAASSLHNLGMLLITRSDVRAAEPLVREALKLRRAHLGADDPQVAETVMVLAHAVATPPIQDSGQAVDLYLEARRIYRTLGDRYLFNLSTIAHNLGEAYTQNERFDQAEASYRESLEIKSRLRLERHPETAVTLNRLASLYETTGDFLNAESTYRQALAIQRDVLDPNHRSLGTTLNNLGGLLRKAKRYGEAEPLYREAVEIYRNVMGPEHGWVAIAQASLAATLQGEGKYNECIQVADECLRISAGIWPEDHPRVTRVVEIRDRCRAGLASR